MKGMRRLKVSIGSSNQPGKAAARLDGPNAPQCCQRVPFQRFVDGASALKPGTPLPAIRQLATDLQLNPNTVAKSYRLLERDAVIETHGRHGSFVHQQGKKHF